VIKREQDEEAAMERSLRPGAKIYIYTSQLFNSGTISIQFTIDEDNTHVAPGIYKGHTRLGVTVPDLGENL
jgi:hypothetical protein